MSAKTATLAKSLHTVSVIANVAKALATAQGYVNPADFHRFVREALEALGYADATDPYGLAAKAVAVLEKEAARTDRGAARTATVWDGMSERPGYC
jgi:hypothetical protein